MMYRVRLRCWNEGCLMRALMCALFDDCIRVVSCVCCLFCLCVMHLLVLCKVWVVGVGWCFTGLVLVVM